MLLELLLFSTIIFLVIQFLRKKKFDSPPGPTGFPFFGYLPKSLGRKAYERFDVWAKQYGDIYRLRIGGRMYFVLNNYDIIREAYVHDGQGQNFLSRPQDFNIFGCAFEFRPMPFKNGPEWACHRKMFNSLLRRSDVRTEASIHQSAEQIVRRIRELSADGPVDVYNIIAEGVVNIVSTLGLGRRLMDTDPELAKQILDDTRRIFTNAPGGDGMLAGWIVQLLTNPFTKKRRNINEITKREFDIMENFVREHEADFDSSNIRDYIDVCLNERSKFSDNDWLSTRNISSNVLVLFVSGVDTTTTTMYFALFLLAKHLDVQEKCMQEIRSVIGKDVQSVKASDRSRLPYMTAVLNEINRYAVVGPLPQPRENVNRTRLGGYDIPAGSHFITNLWSASRDGKYFANPHQFDPNNFFGKDIPRDVASLVFSAGKRACPGESFAQMEVFIFIARILQNFYVLPVPGEELIETLVPGFTRTLAPFKLMFKSRR